jgi:competence protein ComEC
VLFVPEHPSDLPPTTPAARRATITFVLVAAGELVALALWRAHFTAPSSVWFGAALLVLAAGAARRGGPWSAVLGLVVVLLSGGVFTARVFEIPASSLALAIPASVQPGGGSIVTLEGVVVEPMRESRATGALASYLPMGGGSVSFTVRSQSAIGRDGVVAVGGRVRVTVRGGRPGVEPGDRVRITGIARLIEPPSNPGESDARLWAGQEGLAARLTIASPDLIEQLEPAGSVLARCERWWLGGRSWLRSRASAVLGDGGDSPGRLMLGALLLGERESGTEEIRGTFARQGLAHVLAISGFHLAVMAGAALFAVRLTGDRGRLEPILVALLVVLYVLILPTRAPILRAAAMVLAWLGAESLGRRYDKRALLAWVAIGVLVVRPLDLLSLGYQLTFGITAALVWFGAGVHGRLFPAALRFERHEPPDVFERRWWWGRATRLVSASLLCWCVATPIAARTVGMVSPTAVFATIVVVPAVTVLLWAGYTALVVGVLIPPAGAATSAVLDWLAGGVLIVVRFFDTIPLTTLHVPKLSLGLTAAMTVLVLLWLVRGRLRSPGLWAATLVVCGWAGGEVYTADRVPRGTLLRIDTINVGDGTCHLVRSGREAMLWDCGSLYPGIGVRVIPGAIRELGVWRVREVVITHPNFDHYSGLLDVMDRLGVERVTVSRAFTLAAQRDEHGAAAAFVAGVRARGVAIRERHAGDTLSFGRADVRVLSPPAGSPYTEANDSSLVARFAVQTTAGERRLLLCGDIQRAGLAGLMSPGADLSADGLELPHHGSVQPTALAFVDEVGPAVVLQSTGPSRALDIRWNTQRVGREWWTTATDGASWVEFRADGSIESGSVRR